MSTPSEELVRDLLIYRAHLACSIAASMVLSAEPSSFGGTQLAFWEMSGVKREVELLEAVNCALLQFAGMSWDALAARTDRSISRQALHKRVAPLADEARDTAQDSRDYHLRQMLTDLSLLVPRFVDIEEQVFDHLESTLDEGVRAVMERRAVPLWWDKGRA